MALQTNFQTFPNFNTGGNTSPQTTSTTNQISNPSTSSGFNFFGNNTNSSAPTASNFAGTFGGTNTSSSPNKTGFNISGNNTNSTAPTASNFAGAFGGTNTSSSPNKTGFNISGNNTNSSAPTTSNFAGAFGGTNKSPTSNWQKGNPASGGAQNSSTFSIGSADPVQSIYASLQRYKDVVDAATTTNPLQKSDSANKKEEKHDDTQYMFFSDPKNKHSFFKEVKMNGVNFERIMNTKND
ncbi:hypothetical protein GPJ56_003403 [Histomonas meleagridis]|uniref:uncharacterized protein n=1 Tax=Histomonas meleagridis TaxID=135588 RepID=UPI00355A2325|nr:hypothetical protein GPJ56_003403 [Histomonas meleagridis]KAH0805022.1 hypothetical protein GO595_001967 [Histomonas meleagridis]